MSGMSNFISGMSDFMRAMSNFISGMSDFMRGMFDFWHFFQIIGNIVKDITLTQNRKFQMEKIISMRRRF